MSDDAPPYKSSKASRSSVSTASTTGMTTGSATLPPPGHSLRRAFTVDESRLRPPLHGISPESSTFRETPRRRSSNFTDYSLGDARDLLNPKVQESGVLSQPESSSLGLAALTCALLPPVAGLFFKNGSAVATDLLLLGVAGIFLHWSVTQPWGWYHSAQEVRVQYEASAEQAIADDSDVESPDEQSPSGTSLDDVPEDATEERSSPKQTPKDPLGLNAQQRSALNELYKFEILALLACFVLPLLSAYLLHTIRSRLSRPSEGLVSDYNLTVFAMVSELRVFSHLFRLLQSRTLHLQRIVHANPFDSTSGADGGRIKDVLERLGKLEDRSTAEQAPAEKEQTDPASVMEQNAAVTRDVRSALQPEIDALNRAVRRYEKKTGTLQVQTEARLAALEGRLNDAIALAAAAAKNSASRGNVFSLALEYAVAILLYPFNLLLRVLLFPLMSLLRLVNRKPVVPPPTRSRSGKTGKTGQMRYGVDRLSSRVTKR